MASAADLPLDFVRKGRGSPVMETTRPLDPETREAAVGSLLEALTALLEGAAEQVTRIDVVSHAQQLRDLCEDAAVLCHAMAIITRRASL